MRILDRYITKQFLLLFFAILLSMVSIYLLIDFFGKIRMFMSNNATISQMARHFFYLIPMVVSQTTPAVILLTTLVTFGNLSRHNEITAMKANGVSVYRAAGPAVVISLIISMALFVFSELITPPAYERAEHIRLVEVQKQKALGTFKQDQIWYRGVMGIYNFRMYDASTDTIKGVTINVLDKRFRLIQRIDAERAEWKNGRWEFHRVLVTTFPEGSFPILEKSDFRVVDLPERPSDFRKVQKEADKMGFFELLSYVRKLRNEGYDVTRYLADLHGRVAFCFVSILMVIMGVCFSLRSERSGTLAQSIGAGIIIGFSYWLVHAFALSLGRSGTIPPAAAAWTANAIFGVAAVYLLRRVPT